MKVGIVQYNMNDKTLHFIQNMPKAELHVHLEGCISPEALFQLAQDNQIVLGASSPETLKQIFNYRNFDDFRKVLLLCIQVLKKPEDFYNLAHLMGSNFKNQNIKYAEVYWTPQFYRRLGYSYDELFDALTTASTEIGEQLGIIINWIPDLVRSRPDHANEVMLWATRESSREGGVVALGLAGPEQDFPLEPFVNVFAEAGKRGLPANPHCGEGTSSKMIREVIETLRPKRIGHGVSSYADEGLMNSIRGRGITLEICLSSNIKLGLFSGYTTHPLSRLIDAGCQVTLNTDDPALFSTTLTREYALAVKYCGITLPQLEKLALNAIRAAYLPDDLKRQFLHDFQTDFDSLRSTC